MSSVKKNLEFLTFKEILEHIETNKDEPLLVFGIKYPNKKDSLNILNKHYVYFSEKYDSDNIFDNAKSENRISKKDFIKSLDSAYVNAWKLLKKDCMQPFQEKLSIEPRIDKDSFYTKFEIIFEEYNTSLLKFILIISFILQFYLIYYYWKKIYISGIGF